MSHTDSPGDTLRWIAKVRGPNDPRLMPGTPKEQLRARNEWQRARNAQGIVARWDEISAERLVHSRYWIEDTETGNLYREFGGDPGYARTVCAYYLRDGWPVMLEPADPPSRDEIEKRRTAKERRRVDQAAAAKSHYDRLRR